MTCVMCLVFFSSNFLRGDVFGIEFKFSNGIAETENSTVYSRPTEAMFSFPLATLITGPLMM